MVFFFNFPSLVCDVGRIQGVISPRGSNYPHYERGVLGGLLTFYRISRLNFKALESDMGLKFLFTHQYGEGDDREESADSYRVREQRLSHTTM